MPAKAGIHDRPARTHKQGDLASSCGRRGVYCGGGGFGQSAVFEYV
jgi:hypothetical protein